MLLVVDRLESMVKLDLADDLDCDRDSRSHSSSEDASSAISASEENIEVESFAEGTSPTNSGRISPVYRRIFAHDRSSTASWKKRTNQIARRSPYDDDRVHSQCTLVQHIASLVRCRQMKWYLPSRCSRELSAISFFVANGRKSGASLLCILRYDSFVTIGVMRG